jgi:hypothetical protein
MVFKKSFKRIQSLLMKSAAIQIEIDRETQRRSPDWMRLLMLKKQRLIIKDTLKRFTKKSRIMQEQGA